MSIDDPFVLQNLSYSARELRLLATAALPDEQVVNPSAGGLLVAQRAAGTNMSVDVAAGIAVIAGDDQADQGNYVVRNKSVANVVIPAAPGSNSRIDIVYLQVRDPDAGGSAGNDANFGVISGTAAASPTAPTLPATAIELARVTVASGTSAITNAMISDRRFPPTTSVGRGAAMASTSAEESTTSTSAVALATAVAATVVIGSSGKALFITTGSVRMSAGFNADAFLGFELSGANTRAMFDQECLIAAGAAATDKVAASRVALLTGLNPGSTVVTQKARVASGTGQFAKRELTVIPL